MEREWTEASWRIVCNGRCVHREECSHRLAKYEISISGRHPRDHRLQLPGDSPPKRKEHDHNRALAATVGEIPSERA